MVHLAGSICTFVQKCCKRIFQHHKSVQNSKRQFPPEHVTISLEQPASVLMVIIEQSLGIGPISIAGGHELVLSAS